MCPLSLTSAATQAEVHRSGCPPRTPGRHALSPGVSGALPQLRSREWSASVTPLADRLLLRHPLRPPTVWFEVPVFVFQLGEQRAFRFPLDPEPELRAAGQADRLEVAVVVLVALAGIRNPRLAAEAARLVAAKDALEVRQRLKHLHDRVPVRLDDRGPADLSLNLQVAPLAIASKWASPSSTAVVFTLRCSHSPYRLLISATFMSRTFGHTPTLAPIEHNSEYASSPGLGLLAFRSACIRSSSASKRSSPAFVRLRFIAFTCISPVFQNCLGEGW